MARSSSLARRLRRLALYGLAGLAVLYLLGAGAGYYWIHSIRKNTEVSFLQVALLQFQGIRRGVAVQQFATGKKEWDAKNFQAAYLAFVSGVRNDPDNVPGRLLAVEMLNAAGAGPMSLSLLEDGLARAPDNRQLLERTYGLLTSTGRDQRALELLHRLPAARFAGPNGPLLRTYEALATLNLDGAPAARALLEQHPEMEKFPAAAPVVATIRWESRERLKALELMAAHVRTPAAGLADFTQLAHWQDAAGRPDDALATAGLACERFPKDPAAAVLRVEVLAVKSGRGREGQEAIIAYLGAFGGSPVSLNLLAQLAAGNGWLELTRALYEIGATREADLTVLALCYADALGVNRRYAEARQILVQLEAQGVENAYLVTSLRQRQVMLAAAQGDRDTTRDAARRLAALLRGSPERLELARRRFASMGIAEAVEELSAAAPLEKTTASR